MNIVSLGGEREREREKVRKKKKRYENIKYSV